MDQLYSHIIGWGKYAPENVVTNYDLEKTIDTSHEWIMQRTGIAERHIATENETSATMAVAAAHQALAEANLTPQDLDLIVVATSSPDYHVPAVSSTIQAMLEANCPAFTLVTGCTGFVYGLVTAHQFVVNRAFKHVLVVGVELVSRFLDWDDRNTCVLFGDGAGAVIVTGSETSQGILGFDLGSDGAEGHHLMMDGGGSKFPMSHEVIDQGQNFLRMNGREVFKFASRVLPRSTKAALANSGLSLDQLDLLIPHQANARIIDMAVRSMKIDPNKVFVNLQKYGNTSAASIPIALVEAIEEDRLQPGDTVALVSFGAGLTWATAILQWGGKA